MRSMRLTDKDALNGHSRDRFQRIQEGCDERTN
jgi:hypothetical protein